MNDTHWWMVHREFGVFDDSTSAELIWIRGHARDLVEQVESTLMPHGIYLKDSRVETGMSSDYHGTSLRLILAFDSAEDLAMARLLLDPQT